MNQTDPATRPLSDPLYRMLTRMISEIAELRVRCNQIIEVTCQCKQLMAQEHAQQTGPAVSVVAARAAAEAAHLAEPYVAPPAEPQVMRIEWDALREKCRQATEIYLDSDQFFAAWQKFVRRAKAAGAVREDGYPDELVPALLDAITNRQGFWANPNQDEVAA
jgi:hypothetical protein